MISIILKSLQSLKSAKSVKSASLSGSEATFNLRVIRGNLRICGICVRPFCGLGGRTWGGSSAHKTRVDTRISAETKKHLRRWAGGVGMVAVAWVRPCCRRGLADDDLGGLVALTLDQELACLGSGDADTLEVEVLDRSVGVELCVGCDVLDSGKSVRHDFADLGANHRVGVVLVCDGSAFRAERSLAPAEGGDDLVK